MFEVCKAGRMAELHWVDGFLNRFLQVVSSADNQFRVKDEA